MDTYLPARTSGDDNGVVVRFMVVVSGGWWVVGGRWVVGGMQEALARCKSSQNGDIGYVRVVRKIAKIA